MSERHQPDKVWIIPCTKALGVYTAFAEKPDFAGSAEYPRADRECPWKYQGVGQYRTGCGKIVDYTTELDRPCWCGGRVKL